MEPDRNLVLKDLTDFVGALRVAGLTIGVGESLNFTRAVGGIGIRLLDLYWAGRATLISAPEDIGTYNRVFAGFFLSPWQVEGTQGDHADATLGSPAAAATPEDEAAEGEGEQQVGAAASDVEVLRQKWFEACTPAELAALQRLVQELRITVPPRPTRRMRPVRRGRRPDLRGTLRRAMRTHGEPVGWSWQGRRVRHRRLVLLLDVSGSMGEYSRALLGFGYAAIRSGIQAECFSFGTRVTRITPHLRRGGPDEALSTAAHHVEDWDGGTLIGASLRAFRERWGTSLARGAIVVICSDGLERGDPEPLRREIVRLQRLAHRVVWVNPLKGVPGYAPTARGMATALPHVDRFVSGHDLSSLEDLAGLLPRLR